MKPNPWLCLFLLTLTVVSAQSSVHSRLRYLQDDWDAEYAQPRETRINRHRGSHQDQAYDLAAYERISELGDDNPALEERPSRYNPKSLGVPLMVSKPSVLVDDSDSQAVDLVGDELQAIPESASTSKNKLKDSVQPNVLTSQEPVIQTEPKVLHPMSFTFIFIYIAFCTLVAMMIALKFSLYTGISSHTCAKGEESFPLSVKEKPKEIPFSSALTSFISQHRRINEESIDTIEEGMFSGDASCR
uniref:Uncharacterized protein n=1 Tax=Euplotes harpa TaxID=151035 RepID=A0A7S3JFE9_9SPIT|mmetsp:Transcript_37625/g.43230  ORF Transcript_37625/g.43230 Transcript_37625/m.43230 type:complete len:245 (+) Transcript_37625:13-747(+)